MKVWRLGLALLFAAPVVAQTTAAEAIALARRYHDTHNSHGLAATMAFYAPDARFQLNMGRPLVSGAAAITELERFDVIAGSMLFPYQWRAEQAGEAWLVHVDGVIESSRIFNALGLPVVVAIPEAPVMILREGRIILVNQPPLRPACTGQITAGFSALAKWLANDVSTKALVDNGRLVLTTATLPRIIDLIRVWRAASAWRPDPAQVGACAEPSVGKNP
jgi:hypothetical protein